MNQTIKWIKTLLEGFFSHENADEVLSVLNDSIYACGFAEDFIITNAAQAKMLLGKMKDRKTQEEKCVSIGCEIATIFLFVMCVM